MRACPTASAQEEGGLGPRLAGPERRADGEPGASHAPGQAPPASRALRPGSPPAHVHTHRGTRVHLPRHTQAHPFSERLIIAVKKPHPTLVSRASCRRQKPVIGTPSKLSPGSAALGPDSTPQRPQGHQLTFRGRMTHSSGCPDRHEGEVARAGREPRPPSGSPNTDSPHGQADGCTHAAYRRRSEAGPGGPERTSSPLPDTGRSPLPQGPSLRKDPRAGWGPRGTTWPPGPSPSSVCPQPCPGPAGRQPRHRRRDPGNTTKALVRPDHPAGPDTHQLWPPTLRTSCLKSLYSAKACRPRARTLGRTTVLEPPAAPGPRDWDGPIGPALQMFHLTKR